MQHRYAPSAGASPRRSTPFGRTIMRHARPNKHHGGGWRGVSFVGDRWPRPDRTSHPRRCGENFLKAEGIGG
jgi:hypothetical protein